MCGIAGSFGRVRPDDEAARRTMARMRRRGPDHAAVHRDATSGAEVTLIHSRLAILDLDPRANQPFRDEDCALTFNGEIYNFLEIRQELTALGWDFRTGSDTEVVVKAYRQWGTGCLDRFEGMWAFALFDRRSGHLWLSRDRFGEKPLFLMRHRDTLWFASEVSFLAELSGCRPPLDERHLKRFLVNGFRSLFKQPASYFDGIEELPPASSLLLSDEKASPPETYWHLGYAPRPMTLSEAEAGVSRHLERAVEIRLRADVPIAFCLSGGVDSNVLAGLAVKRFGQRIHTFSIIDDDPRYDERQNIAAAVRHLDCDHHEIHTSPSGFWDRLQALVDYQWAPVSTITAVIQAHLVEAIAAAGYRVAIMGGGADELFTGYYDHYGLWLANMAGRPDFDDLVAQWRTSYGAFVNNPQLQDPLAFARNPDHRGHLYLDRELFNGFLRDPWDEDFFEARFCDDPLRNRMLNELRHEIVPVLLREADGHSMYHSVESRSPYLDRSLAEFLATVPSELLIKDGYAKRLLRQAGRPVVAPEVLADKRKRGFNAPIDSLVNRHDPAMLERLLNPGPIFDIVRRDAMERFIRGDLHSNSCSTFLFRFISARLFLESF